MAKLYLITGPAGVGKSTISTKLAESLEKSAVVEGDTIYNQVVGSYKSAWKEGNHLKLFWKICMQNIKLYLDAGYDVVFNYIIKLSDLEELKMFFLDNEIKFVVLLTNEDELLRRDALRPEDCQMKERCVVLLNNFKNRNYNTNNIIDTTNLTVAEIVNIVIEDERFRV